MVTTHVKLQHQGGVFDLKLVLRSQFISLAFSLPFRHSGFYSTPYSHFLFTPIKLASLLSSQPLSDTTNMSAYYPSSYGGGGHHHSHHGSQVVYSNGGYMPSAGYGVQPGVVYVPPTSRSYSMGSRFHDDDYDSRSHRRRSRSFYRRRGRHDQRAYSYPNSYTYSGVPVSQVAAPMMVVRISLASPIFSLAHERHDLISPSLPSTHLPNSSPTP